MIPITLDLLLLLSRRFPRRLVRLALLLLFIQVALLGLGLFLFDTRGSVGLLDGLGEERRRRQA